MSRRLAPALAVAEARSRIVEAVRPVNELRIELSEKTMFRARIECGPDGKLIAVPFPTQDSAVL
jgi:hypothetical protein